MTTTVPIEDLPALEGSALGTSGWIEVTQSMIDQFADATHDYQWIHTDVERAKDGPFGGPIAHGYLTLSLLIPLWTDLLDVTGVRTKVNYGLEKVRFPAPVPAGARIRAVGSLSKVEQVAGGGVQLTGDVTVEIENADKPACVARPVFRFYP
ncbi:MaoC family dehydratase [Amycolatopsis benzoatilytica]|uniref:MaoC family dehydratase n=1 Tax=Amycolatopsis benzoatilytica TaxID=346045 RepID=UPI000364E77E|nr:MaoC family dehydratase [Amycolatopsis benzoatilytica]